MRKKFFDFVVNPWLTVVQKEIILAHCEEVFTVEEEFQEELDEKEEQERDRRQADSVP